MSRRAMIKTHRIAPGVYLSLQARSQDVLAELYADGLHDRAPVMFACSAIEEPADVFLVGDGTGLVIGSMQVVMPEADAASLSEWMIARLPVLEVA
ncbi:hypothetical protein [Xanthomonas cucurbitae]|uniref:Uncharacterized protein n=1 Tax=Xanthomonas cucurbitae TaxID=56453 RepID=A0ABY7Y8K2_9XANT|nr:hypothetical protein [Xanthomonas cucurbitae]WDM66307.1 hypothetical protein K6981_12125 [Xanthomonas cucurbitae]WDM70184.1 hypothetical protein K6978_12095 [Xanthomonas cucurbitae]